MPVDVIGIVQQSLQDGTYQHPELVNLVPYLDEQEGRGIAMDVLDSFKDDDESRSGWLDMHADWLRLYFQQDRPINPPWEGSSGESIPQLAEACNQFHSRAYQAMFPNREIIKAIPVGNPDPSSTERAKRVSKHMSWQLIAKDKSYRKDKDRLLLSLPLHGSFFTKTYYDPVKKRNVTRNIRATDLVVPYGTGPRNLEDIDRKSEIIWMSENRTRILAAKGYFAVPAKAMTIISKQPTDQAHDDALGLTENSFGRNKMCKLIEQHMVYDLDGDGIAEPYIAVVDMQSRVLLRLSIRWDTDEAGYPQEDMEPVEYYTHYAFLENPDGFYGLGYGHLIGQLNTAINKLIRQTVDAGTLANAGNMSGYISQTLATKKGENKLQLGKFIAVPSTMEDISKGIFQFNFPGPQPALATVAELLLSRADRLSLVTEAVSGQTEKVMQPTTVLALLEQSQQIYSSIFERVIEAWGCELQKHFRLNGKYMDPQEYFTVLDVDGTLLREGASRDDYLDDLQIQPIADPKSSSQRQKLAKAEAEWAFCSQNPLILQSPMHFRNACRRYLEALDVPNIDEVLPRVDPPIRVDDPRQENMMAISGMGMPPALPDQDHLMHLQAHEEVLVDPMYSRRLSPDAIANLKAHNNQHLAFLYGAIGGSGLGMGTPLAGGPEGMGGAAGGPMVLSGGSTAVPGEGGLASSSVMGVPEPSQRPSGGPAMDRGAV